MTSRSLTRRLVVNILVAEFLCALVFSTLAIVHERDLRQHAFDIALRGRADSLLGAVQDAEDPEDNVMVDSSELTLPGEDRFQVLSPSGRVLGRSPIDDPALLALGSRHSDGFFNFSSQGTSYRALRTPGMRVIDRVENGGLRRPVTLLYAVPTTHLWHEVMEAVRFYILLSTILLAVTGLLLAWILRRGLSPLRELADRAGHVSTANWEFSPPPATLQTRELAPIALAIRALLSDLKAAFERERQFTGDAAHELKTSAAILKSSLQLLSMRQRSPAEYADGLNTLLLDLERMEDLITRMLTLTRIREAPLAPPSATDLQQLVHSLAQRFQPIADNHTLSLQVQTPSPALALIDEEDAEILCSNLLMNALQHSPRGGEVLIILNQTDTFVQFSVLDHGAGIPTEALPHVFERFFRADVSRSRRSGGAGLGLATCKAITDRYHGSIHIESTPGAGTRAIVRLPSALIPAEPETVFSMS